VGGRLARLCQFSLCACAGRRRGAMADDEPRSWGEAIQQYAKAKIQRPRPDHEYSKPYRVTRYEKSREEVEYHPILQTFRDTSREHSAVSNEASGRVSQLNRAKDKQIAYESPYDILTFADKREPLPRPPPAAAQAMTAPFNPHAERPTFRHPLDSCYQYNIVSNLPLSQHHYTAPELRPNVVDELTTIKPRLQHMAALPRDFNILSNRYVERHDDKSKLEREIQRNAAAAKYWETHDYEPILGHYLLPCAEHRPRAAPHRVARRRRAAPHRAAPHHAVPHRAVPHRAAPHRAATRRIALHHTAPRHTAPHRTTPHDATRIRVHPRSEKEERFQDFMANELAGQSMKSFNRLPPSLQRGEGFVYDITTHQARAPSHVRSHTRCVSARALSGTALRCMISVHAHDTQWLGFHANTLTAAAC
jgi:hypothetical protein